MSSDINIIKMVKNSNTIKKVIVIITLLTLILTTTIGCTTNNTPQLNDDNEQHLEPQVITLCKEPNGKYTQVIGGCNEE